MMTDMTVATPIQALTKKDFESGLDVRWCPGCGDYAVLSQITKLMPKLGIPRENFAFVSGIGCSKPFSVLRPDLWPATHSWSCPGHRHGSQGDSPGVVR